MRKEKLIFVTGNKYKIAEAEVSFKKYGLEFEAKPLDIDEIQNHEPLKITESKVRTSYEMLKRPVIVHDSNWSIPALSGFPGGYMKDVTSWFEPEDFLNLMRGKKDRSIYLIEMVAYFDGDNLKTFSEKHELEFVEEPRGFDGSSLDRVTKHRHEDKTVSEIYDLQESGDDLVEDDTFQVWIDFLDWYKEEIK